MTTRQYHPTEISISASGSYANPFTDIYAEATFTKGATSITVPMFYDGGVKWNARFSPPEGGNWSYSITSVPYDSGLDKSNVIIVPNNNNAQVHGRLGVSGKHFTFEDGTPFFYLGYEADWLWAMDNMDAGLIPNTKAFIDTIKAHGFTSVCIQAFAYSVLWNTQNGDPPQSLFDYGPPPLLPWPGSYGSEDHLRMNLSYWNHFDKVMDYLHSQGIVVHLMLRVYNKNVNWPADLSAGDDLWHRYIVARYQGYSNVVWDTAKESYNKDGSDGGVYHRNRIDYIRSLDGHGLLVTTHDPVANDYRFTHQNDNYVDFRSDQINFWQYDMSYWVWNNYSKPYVAIEYGYEESIEDPAYPGVDFGQWNYGRAPWGESQTWDVKLKRTWRVAMAGGYCNYYYTLTSWDMLKWEPNPPGYDAHLAFSNFWQALPYQEMDPHPEFIVPQLPIDEDQDVYCRAKPGEYYVFFCQRDNFTFTLNIQGATAPLEARWIDGATGNTIQTLPSFNNGQHAVTVPVAPVPKIPVLLMTPTVSAITVDLPQDADVPVEVQNVDVPQWADTRVEEEVVAGGIYPSGLAEILANQALPNLPIRAALLNGYSFDPSHTLISDVSGSEIGISGYSRLDITGLQVIQVSENIYYRANSLYWAALGGSVLPEGVVLYFAGSSKLLSYHPLTRSKVTDGSPFQIDWPAEGFIKFGQDTTSTSSQNFPQIASGLIGAGGVSSIGANWYMNAYHGRLVLWRSLYGRTLVAPAKVLFPDRIFIATSDLYLHAPDQLAPLYDDWWLKDGSGQYVELTADRATYLPNGADAFKTLHDNPINPGSDIDVLQYLASLRVQGEAQPALYAWDGWEHDWFLDASPYGTTWDYNRDGSNDGALGTTRLQETQRNYIEALTLAWISATGKPPILGYNSGQFQSYSGFQDLVSFRISEHDKYEHPTWNYFRGLSLRNLSDFGGYQPLGAILVPNFDGGVDWSEWAMTPPTELTNRTDEPLTNYLDTYFNYDPLRKVNWKARQSNFAYSRFLTTLCCMGDAWLSQTYGPGNLADWYFDEYHTDLGAPLGPAYRLGKGPRPTNPTPLPDLGPTDQPTPSVDETRLYGCALIRFFERGVAVCYLPRNDWMTTIEITEADLQAAAAALGLSWAGPYYKFLGTQAPVAVYVDDSMVTSDNDDFGVTTAGTWIQTTAAHWTESQVAAWGNTAKVKAAGAGTGTVQWVFEVPVEDDYDVWVMLPHRSHGPDMWESDGGGGRQAAGYLNQIFDFAEEGLTGPFATNAHYTINHDDGAGTPTDSTATADLSANVRAQKLGTFHFRAGVFYHVILDDGNGADGPLIADGLYLEAKSALYNDGSQFNSVRFFGGVSTTRDINPTGSVNKDIVGDGIILKTEADFLSQVGMVSGAFPINGTYPGVAEAEFFGTWVNQYVPSHYPNTVANDNPHWSQMATGTERGGLDQWGYKEAAQSASNYAIHRIPIRRAGLYDIYEWHGWRGQTNLGNQASNVPYEVRVVDTPGGGDEGGSGLHERYNLGNENYPNPPDDFVDGSGDTWTADPGPSAGSSFDNFQFVVDIAGTTDDLLYQTERYGPDFTYTFPVPNGDYTVRIHFAELYWGPGGAGGSGGVGSRVFDIYINGQLRLQNYDIYAEVGSITATFKEFLVTVTTSQIDIRVVASADQCKISAIEFFETSTITGFGTINQNANFGQWNLLANYNVQAADIGKWLEVVIRTDTADDIVVSEAIKFELTTSEEQPITKNQNQTASLVMEADPSQHSNYPRVFGGFLGAGGELRGSFSGLFYAKGGHKDIVASHSKYVFCSAATWGPLLPTLKAKYPDRYFIAAVASWLPGPGDAGTNPPQGSSTNWWYESLFGPWAGTGAAHEVAYVHAANFSPTGTFQYPHLSYAYGGSFPGGEQDLPDGRVGAPTFADPFEGDQINGGQLAAREVLRWALGIHHGRSGANLYQYDGYMNDWYYPAWFYPVEADWDHDGIRDSTQGVTESQQNDWWLETVQTYTSELVSYFLSKTGRNIIVGVNSGNALWTSPANFPAANLGNVMSEGFHWQGTWWQVAEAMDTWKLSTFGNADPIGHGLVVMATSFGSAEWGFIPVQTTQHTSQVNIAPNGYGNQDPNRKVNYANLRDAFARQCRFGLTMACCFESIFSVTVKEHRFNWFYDEYHADLGAPLAPAVRLGKGPRPTNPNPADLGPTDQPTYGTDTTNIYGCALIRFFERGAVIHYVPRNDWTTSIVVTKADLQAAATLAGLTWNEVAPAGDLYYLLGQQAKHQIWVDDGMNVVDDPTGLGFGCVRQGGGWIDVGSAPYWTDSVNIAMQGQRAYVCPEGSGTNKIRWQFTVPVDDEYDVFMTMAHLGYDADMYNPTDGSNTPIGYLGQIFNFGAAGLIGPFAPNARYTIYYDDGFGGLTSTVVRINQSLSVRGQFLGKFRFQPGIQYRVELDDGGTPGGPLWADAIFIQSTKTLFNRGTTFVQQRFFGGVGSEAAIAPSGDLYKRIVGDGVILKTTPNFVSVAGHVVGNFAINDTDPGVSSEATYVGAGWQKSAVLSHQYVSLSPFEENPDGILQDNPYYTHTTNNAEVFGGIDAWGQMLGPRDNTRNTYASYRWLVKVNGTYRLSEWHGWVGKDPGAESAAVPFDIRSNGTPIASGTINQTANHGQWNQLQQAQLVKGTVIELRIYTDVSDADWVVADACKLQLISAS